MGEKPVRALQESRQGMTPHASTKLVKVYRLEDNGRWAAQGTGHVTIGYVLGSSEISLAVVDVEYNDMLLLHKITPDDSYTKQETIISWRDPEKALELALSFEGPAGCSYIWEIMCNIREELQSKILHPNEVPKQAVKSLEASRFSQLHDKSLSSVNGGLKERSSLESFSSKTKKCSRHVPPLELSSLLAILKNVQTILQCGVMMQTRTADLVSKDEEGGAAVHQFPNMAPTALMTLDDMPLELLEEVVRRVPCRTDRARLRCCSTFWRDLVSNLPEQLQLPWLLYPSTVELLYYTVTGDRFGKFNPIPVEVQQARFAGASDGDWLVLVSAEPHSHALFHLFSGRSIWLPTAMMMDSRSVNVMIISAVLSGNPFSGDFTVAAIVDIGDGMHRRAAFWQGRMQLWADCGHVAWQRAEELAAEGKYLPLDTELVDLVYICGTFWYLTSEEELVKLIPVEDCNGQQRMVARGVKVQLRDDFEPDEEVDEEEVFEKGKGQVTWRYLVESSGEPIMVVRYIEGAWTVGIRLFRLQSDGDRFWWEELFELPGETFFIGHGCSRSYKIGHELLKVYFFHDRMTRLRGRNLYWRTDSGKATHIGVLRWPVLLREGIPVPAASDQAPLSWVLH